MVVRIPPPVVFALFLAAGLLLNLDHMRQDRAANHRREVASLERGGSAK